MSLSHAFRTFLLFFFFFFCRCARRSISDRDGRKGVIVMEPVIRALRDTAREPTPESVMVFPLWQKPLFPGTLSTTIVQDEGFYASLREQTEKGKRFVGLFLTKKEAQSGVPVGHSISDLSEIHSIGLLGSVIDIQPVGHNKLQQVVLSGVRRIAATGVVEGAPRFSVTVEDLKEEPYEKEDRTIKAYCQEIIATLREITRMDPFYKEQVHLLAEQVDFNNPAELADLVAAIASSRDGAQRVLEELNVAKRLRIALEHLKSELETNKIRHKLAKEVEKNFAETQRKYFLREQLNIIQKELGIVVDERGALVEKFKTRLNSLVVPAHAKKVIDEELTKLSTLEPSGSEFNVTRTYLDWLTQLPWGMYKQENLGLDHAKQVLDEDHYGLKELKERIMEFIAVGNLTGGVSGKIILLVGPPGTGKTSVGKSIARALDREFFRFSVGGMSDVSEIKGHRRTYVGAMPGKLIQALKLMKSSNPVVLIDEIDKMGRGYQGDPASALLEVLDPAQNSSFLDHYLDVGFDLSKVLFVCTANSLDTIPGPLLDRMEVMRLSGYIMQEKVEIAKRYLVPKSQKESGVDPKKIRLQDGAIKSLITDYAREAGVRNLEKLIDKIHRKAAYKLVSGASKTVTVSPKSLHDYVGQPVFRSDRYYEGPLPPGVVTGLAWTSMGGATLYIETVVERVADSSKSGASLKTTGKMGEVMKESTEIALTYAKRHLKILDANNDFFTGAVLHMHIPEGATPKDGPSAGVTMVTSLLSLALNRPVPDDLAMTGEITLTGKVLPIGGVKEKVIAAKRSKVTRVLLPVDNKRDWEELEDAVKEGVTPTFCTTYDDVWKAVTKKTSATPATTATNKKQKAATTEEPDILDELDLEEEDHDIVGENQ